ncbi:hypothetical protein JHK82_026132 [Glycine max]|uniref:Uncharacterized protein n=1 Tax=Glycine max TaxID=3847 RepID=A0A0R0ID66_SOYBN|nr:hypothetical protein JHK85_026742 [Glycine max]KAG5013997.1 hypothetical protein JHK86_026258 [Glycine max]KAG5134944.1 hypothetical protein JHK82_026132 [Glycine max]KAH1044693.1 hypothetical protein GYH30_026113 [Glycine max]KRH40300.1 hypothetical protein GLYMA_09G250100v4 [Glycine max]
MLEPLMVARRRLHLEKERRSEKMGCTAKRREEQIKGCIKRSEIRSRLRFFKNERYMFAGARLSHQIYVQT